MNTLAERFWAKVTKNGTNGCWLWRGGTGGNGYGKFHFGSHSQGTRKMLWAHRVAYQLIIGPIPEGMELDHLCGNHACVNPAHLEPVPHALNSMRGRKSRYNALKTHCPRGHPYDLFNTYLSGTNRRHCRLCARFRAQQRRLKRL